MDEKKVRLLVKNLESLLETLKYELGCDEEQEVPTPAVDPLKNIEFRAAPRNGGERVDWDNMPVDNSYVIPLNDYDEVFSDEN